MKVNTIDWFEIPTEDIQRAKDFYEGLLNVKLEKLNMPDTEMYMFPGHEGDVYGAMGALIHTEDIKPSMNGATVYFNCKNIDDELSRVEKLGGKILMPKQDIGENGTIAQLLDSEGNRVALHQYAKK